MYEPLFRTAHGGNGNRRVGLPEPLIDAREVRLARVQISEDVLVDGLANDVVVGGPPGTDSAPYESAGATWWMAAFSPYDLTVDEVRGVIREGPYSSG